MANIIIFYWLSLETDKNGYHLDRISSFYLWTEGCMAGCSWFWNKDIKLDGAELFIG